MKETRSCILGIDTGNYTTSVAVVDRDGSVSCDLRKTLNVKQGERGLRQSEAFFQHIDRLPDLLSQVLKEHRRFIGAIACADKPRPVEGSYMPVFKAGESFAKSLAAALDVPLYTFSHQEGHIQAVKYYSNIKEKDKFLCYHLSGGTCELLKVDLDNIKIIGGSKDISFGQVIDRLGVAMGMEFPAGAEMDKLALVAKKTNENQSQSQSQSRNPAVSGKAMMKPIPLDGLFFNLSGLETQCSRKIEAVEQSGLIKELFENITKALITLTEKASAKTGINDILFVGGVASSGYISEKIVEHFAESPIHIVFGNESLARDNAVGIALLGGKHLWQQNL